MMSKLKDLAIFIQQLLINNAQANCPIWVDPEYVLAVLSESNCTGSRLLPIKAGERQVEVVRIADSFSEVIDVTRRIQREVKIDKQLLSMLHSRDLEKSDDLAIAIKWVLSDLNKELNDDLLRLHSSHYRIEQSPDWGFVQNTYRHLFSLPIGSVRLATFNDGVNTIVDPHTSLTYDAVDLVDGNFVLSLNYQPAYLPLPK